MAPHSPTRRSRPRSGRASQRSLPIKAVLRLFLVACFLDALWNSIIGSMALYSSWGDSLDAAPASPVAAVGSLISGRSRKSVDGGDSSSPPVIAYAISLIKCGDFQSTAEGMTDAALILRHSVHLTSVRNPASGSGYDYKMYAIVHRQAEECSSILKDAGFEVVVKDPPVKQSDIRGKYLRSMIHREWCCGSDEFVKLYAYSLPEEIIVHVDVDFAFYRPMDHLFDALHYDKDSERGRKARSKIELEFPDEQKDKLPDKIGAFITRDWPQVMPGRIPGYQAGFLIARRDPSVVEELKEIVLEGNFTEGFTRDNGWGGMGYGAFVGAMAMQGLLAYYYDVVRPNDAVELNQCKYNHMGMDTRMPFRRKKCRNDRDYCEDCRKTPFENIYNVHYTMCRKPWQCISIGAPGGRTDKLKKNRGNAINTATNDLDHCHELLGKWHDLRSDFERALYKVTEDETIRDGSNGTHKVDVFRGHCSGEGGKSYQTIKGRPESFKKVPRMYDR